MKFANLAAALALVVAVSSLPVSDLSERDIEALPALKDRDLAAAEVAKRSEVRFHARQPSKEKVDKREPSKEKVEKRDPSKEKVDRRSPSKHKVDKREA